MSEYLKLNIGCGNGKLEGFINVDIDPEMKPDLVHDITKRFPYADGTCELIVMYHTIEHISKKYHPIFLFEFWRLLKEDGQLIISYPEFRECYRNWESNYKGMKDFWEATIYGRQASPSDYHVTIMDTPDFTRTLINCGFEVLKAVPEEPETYNSIVKAKKSLINSYELDIMRTVWGKN